jgi:hypothetical protein
MASRPSLDLLILAIALKPYSNKPIDGRWGQAKVIKYFLYLFLKKASSMNVIVS